MGAAALAIRRAAGGEIAPAEGKPNIVILFADDMGYGDPGCFNPHSKTPTPHIDKLAAEGMRFTDAHAPGSWCVPSRYGLMTGRYPFRADRHRIEPDRMTIASLLKRHGYATACVGKWHLGLEGENDPPADKPLPGGPVDRGFDTYFGIHASLDIPPYYYIENDRPVARPTGTIAASSSPGWTSIQGAFWRAGKIAPGFKHDEVLPKFAAKAVEWLEAARRASPGRPFDKAQGRPLFLYLALAAPHTPWLPTGRFRGTSRASDYGDFVAQVDDAVGQVLRTLDKLALRDNTLVIFSSDNGPVWYPQDVQRYAHRSAGPLRGMKGDVWEGGHRMPFIVRWPGRVQPGTTSGQLICFTDVMATFADILGAKLPQDAGEDSFSFLPLLLGKKRDKPVRDTMIHPAGLYGIRHGRWKLILGLGSGGFSKPRRRKPGPGEPKGQLYDLQADLGETRNVYADHPEVVERLTKLLDQQRKAGRTRSPS
jgi:arylsulfatase A-like enzyme